MGVDPRVGGGARTARSSTPRAPRVDPRVGGGAQLDTMLLFHNGGRSPRGRGSPDTHVPSNTHVGSIPAWAGEPAMPASISRPARVDPRVGGGAPKVFCPRDEWPGRSPRGRGSRRRPSTARFSIGSIPAWAGEPSGPRRRCPTRQVDPRVGGGAGVASALFRFRAGRSPRGRGSPPDDRLDERFFGSIPAWAGEPARSTAAASRSGVDPRVGGGATPLRAGDAPLAGRSPRGRGSPVALRDEPGRTRSIPAWAGEPTLTLQKSKACGVDPRVGGGAQGAGYISNGYKGRSPRGRGSLAKAKGAHDTVGSIPAWAGEPRACGRLPSRGWVDPRVGGGAYGIGLGLPGRPGRSPRGRGSRALFAIAARNGGSIPAWAGDPRIAPWRSGHLAVDPRVGGGAVTVRDDGAAVQGRSPRGRGSRAIRVSKI